MRSDYKTLIVCDTNSLRSTEAGEIAYSSFSFGKPYDEIESFINESNLNDFVSLAVPQMVIEELKHQKKISYKKDVDVLSSIIKRLTGLPHIAEGDLNLPDEDFDCADYIEEEANKYIAANGIHLLEFREEDAPQMLKNMLAKVVGNENSKPPFARSGKFNDAGFKDNVIWETLMHYEAVKDFDKIIFFTRDKDFGDCYKDFEKKWERYCRILNSQQLVIAELERDYGNYIKNQKIYEYANKEYFKNYLEDLLRDTTSIDYEGENLKIENYKINNLCSNVEQVPDEEGDYISVEIFSDIEIHTTYEKEKLQIPVSAKTVLSDAEYMEIEETTFEPNIY